MFSFNQRLNTSADDWRKSEELDWLMDISEREYESSSSSVHTDSEIGQQQSLDVSVTDQQTMTPEDWNQQPFVPTYYHQSYTHPETFSISIPVQHHLTPVTHHQNSSLNFPRSGFAEIQQHQAQITLVPNSNEGFKTIVKKKSKRKRTMFTTEQVACLETVFSRKQYVSRDERQILVQKLQVSDNAVKVWFQNRRIRSKRQAEEALEDAYSCEELSESTSFEPSPIRPKLFQKVDENGFVTLEQGEMEVLVSAIDSVLSDDVIVHLAEESESDQSTTGSEVSQASFYEPISPATSDCNDEETLGEQPAHGYEKSLQTLFDLHFC